jgi:hypothetical protein
MLYSRKKSSISDILFALGTCGRKGPPWEFRLLSSHKNSRELFHFEKNANFRNLRLTYWHSAETILFFLPKNQGGVRVPGKSRKRYIERGEHGCLLSYCTEEMSLLNALAKPNFPLCPFFDLLPCFQGDLFNQIYKMAFWHAHGTFM